MKVIQRSSAVVAIAVLGVLASVASAYADASDMAPIGDAAADVKDNLVIVAGTVLPYAAILVAIVVGWRFARRFLKA